MLDVLEAGFDAGLNGVDAPARLMRSRAVVVGVGFGVGFGMGFDEGFGLAGLGVGVVWPVACGRWLGRGCVVCGVRVRRGRVRRGGA